MKSCNGPKRSILCIDDDPVTLTVTERLLTAAGYAVASAGSPISGLDLARAARPDLVLLDIAMPELDGYEVCTRLRQSGETSSIPVVFLTASAEDQDKARAFSLGALDYLVKPVSGKLLLERVRSYLERTGEWKAMDDEAVHWSEGIQAADFIKFKEFLSVRLNLDAETGYKLSAVACSGLYSVCQDIGITPRAMAQSVAEFLKVPYVCNIDPNDIQLGVLPMSFSRSNSIVAIANASVARAYVVGNPFDLDLLDLLRKFSYVTAESQLMVTEPGGIEALFVEPPVPDVKVIPPEHEKPDIMRPHVRIASGPVIEIQSKRPESEVVEYPIIQICNRILQTAVAERASDVHIEPKEASAVVRMRVDGDMGDTMTLKKNTAMKLISRLKLLGDLDIAEKRKPQDGAFVAMVEGRTFNVRLSTTYTPNGESIVLRLLEPYSEAKELKELGMADSQVKGMQRLLARNQGVILVVGPTGSGKTTTVYSILHNIDHKTLSMMSVEDPVEYRIPFANQHQVNDKAGITFESLLKTAVRQDPDVLFLGEVRDNYSAKVALDFASTGHLTITTLHTANATSALFRLERLGIDRGDMADSIAAIMAQTLVRKPCPHCRKVVETPDEERRLLARYTEDIPAKVVRAVGCQNCNYSGYRGREGVYELIEVDREIAEMVRSNVPIQEVRSRLGQSGRWLMSDHALSKVRDLTLTVSDVCEHVLTQEVGLVERGADVEVVQADSGPNGGGSPGGGESALSVLLAVADEHARELAAGFLKAQGYRTAVCRDGDDALAAVDAGEFDLVLADAGPAEIGGLELLSAMKTKAIEVPLILLTSPGNHEEQEEEGLRLGAADCIRKPIRRETLLLRVRKALATGSRVREASLAR